MTTYTGSITRTELGLSDLNIHDGTNYAIAFCDLGQVPVRSETTKSPYVPGTVEIGSVDDDARGSIVIRVTASTHASEQSLIAALKSAFKQTSYTLTVGFDGTNYAVTGRKATVGLKDGWDFAARQRSAFVICEFVRSPVASAGPL